VSKLTKTNIKIINQMKQEGLKGSELVEYLEAHFEICSAICRELSKDVVEGRVGDVQETYGSGGLYELSKELTDKFIELYEGKQWDGEWLDTVDDFIKGKLFNNTFLTKI
jgi:hypothetical protein